MAEERVQDEQRVEDEEELQLDPELISSAKSYGLRDLERVCTLCGSKRRCERDLVRNAGSANWRDYCLNVATLDALQGRATSGNS